MPPDETSADRNDSHAIEPPCQISTTAYAIHIALIMMSTMANVLPLNCP